MSAIHYPEFTLTGKTPATTYEKLLQSNTESSSFVDGLGYEIGVVNLTASNAYQAVSASWAPSSGGGTGDFMVIENSTGDLSIQPNSMGIVSMCSGSGYGKVGIENNVPQYTLDINGNLGDSTNGNYYFSKDGTVCQVNGNNTGGYFGVANAMPSHTLDVNGDINFNGNLLQNNSVVIDTSGSFLGTASFANTSTNVISSDNISVHSQQSLYLLATDNVILSATSALSMEALGGDINMYPSSQTKVYGNLDCTGILTAETGLAPFLITSSNSPYAAFLSANGYNQGDVHGFLGFNGRYWSGDTSFAETARISGIKDAADGQAGGALVFFTGDSGNNTVERLRINSSGNISTSGSISSTAGFIGTSSYAVHLSSGAGLTTIVHLTASVTTMSFINGLLQLVS